MDDVAIWIEARSVARAVPCLFSLVPVDDAVEVSADGRAFVDVAVLVAVDGNLSPAASNDGTLARRDFADISDFALGEIVLELLRYVCILLHVLRSRAQSHARWIVELRPLVLPSLNQFV